MQRKSLTVWLATMVVVHFAITLWHGAAHRGAQVPLSPAAALFVAIVIVIAPLAGLVMSIGWPRLGGWVIAASMTGALVFGFVSHFVIISADHVSHVAENWRLTFGTSAALLMVTEAAAVVLGVRLAMEMSKNYSRMT